MNFQNVALLLMKPGHHDDLVAGLESLQRWSRKRFDFQPRVGSAFEALFWRLAAVRESGSNLADWAKLRALPSFRGSMIRRRVLCFRHNRTLISLVDVKPIDS
jgi:hypothetical protein